MASIGSHRGGTAVPAGTAEGETKKRSLAQLFCLLFGLVLIGAGVLGFFYDNGADFDLPESLQPGTKGELLGLFDINGWHNVVHIASGALLLIGSVAANLARTVALVFGLTYVAVTILGSIDSEDVLGLLPVNTEDNILHGALAGAALLAALLPTREKRVGGERPVGAT